MSTITHRELSVASRGVRLHCKKYRTCTGCPHLNGSKCQLMPIIYDIPASCCDDPNLIEWDSGRILCSNCGKFKINKGSK